MPSDTYKIVIHVDKRSAEEHVRRFSAPTADEVEIVIVREQSHLRYTVLLRMTSLQKPQKLTDATTFCIFSQFLGLC